MTYRGQHLRRWSGVGRGMVRSFLCSSDEANILLGFEIFHGHSQHRFQHDTSPRPSLGSTSCSSLSNHLRLPDSHHRNLNRLCELPLEEKPRGLWTSRTQGVLIGSSQAVPSLCSCRFRMGVLRDIVSALES